MNTPDHRTITVRTSALAIGLRTPRNQFEHMPYERRPDNNDIDGQADYDRLRQSIRAHGVRDPIIVWYNRQTQAHHVLIGMRRATIAREEGIETLQACEILEDVMAWTGDDVTRIHALKRKLGQKEY